MKAAFYTLGCKVNQYDTEAMAELFQGAGYELVPFSEPADVYIVNTCSVTQMSDKKSRQMVSRAHTLAPEALIVVTGCYAQRAPEEVAALPGVKVVSGTKDHGRILQLVEEQLASGDPVNAVGDLKTGTAFETVKAAREGRTRAYLKIQDGCNRYCTYCIIPYTRGPIRSRSLESIREEYEQLAAEGFCEVVLTGIHLMSYGLDMKPRSSVFDAIRAADDVEGIKRIRLGSLEPQALSDENIAYLASNPKICRQFHLSLQSGSTEVLRRMNRRYTAEEYADCVDRLRAAMPDCAITTDIIAGFPGETEEQFQETLRFAEMVKLSRIHAFPYSRRTGTPAATYPDQVPQQVKNRRNKELIALSDRLAAEYRAQFVGTVQSVLFEEMIDGMPEGCTGTYLRVRAAGEESLLGKIADVRIESIEGDKLLGSLICPECS